VVAQVTNDIEFHRRTAAAGAATDAAAAASPVTISVRLLPQSASRPASRRRGQPTSRRRPSGVGCDCPSVWWLSQPFGLYQYLTIDRPTEGEAGRRWRRLVQQGATLSILPCSIPSLALCNIALDFTSSAGTDSDELMNFIHPSIHIYFRQKSISIKKSRK